MKLGVVELAQTVSPKTVWHEFTALRAILNEAVRRKRLALNPCADAVFPARKGWRDRKPESYILTAGEEERVLASAPRHLRNVIVIMVEMGLRPYVELLSMKKAQVDLANRVIDITQSKTEAGKGLMPMTEIAAAAFQDQMELAGDSEYLFPSRPPRNGQPPKRPYMIGLKTAWRATLRRAGVPYFRLYDLRHTFANRLGHGGVVPQYVSQLLRHKTTALVGTYSDLPLEDKRTLLGRLKRQVEEGPAGPRKDRPHDPGA